MTTSDKKKLNSGAKAFVPQSSLKASAASWNPTTTSSSNESNESKPASTPVPAPPLVPEDTNKTLPSNVAKDSSSPPPAAAPVATAATTKPAAAATPAAAPVVSAWGRKPLDAVKSAPTQPIAAPPQRTSSSSSSRPNSQNNNKDKEWRRPSSESGNWSRGKTQLPKKDDKATTNNNGGWQRGKTLPLDLLSPGDGSSERQKGVKRIRAEELLALRLSYVAPPLIWESATEEQPCGPPSACRWTSETRVAEIDAMAKSSRIGGDASQARRKKKEVETAPPLEECKPLEINEETRWKPKVLDKDGSGASNNNATPEETNASILKTSLLILNKLSLTKFQKLSNDFIASGIGQNESCLAGAIELIVAKAQDEPHFAAMYAALCLKLSKTPMEFEPPGKKKVFKKMLLVECQKEFETDTETKVQKALEGETDPEERELKAALVKKHYLGHMRFIGELYKGDLISIKIMLFCLPILLGEGEGNVVDEEKVECFTKLMTVIGYNLEQQSMALREKGKPESWEQLAECWTKVEKMASKDSGIKISNRIKFMLQDLIDMKNNGWTTRREEESAKTIAEIHKEAAKEQKMKRSTSSSSMRRQQSSGDVRNIGRSNSRPQMDKDGFTEVSKPSGFGRSQSLNTFSTSKRQNAKPQEGFKRSASATGGSFAAFNEKSTPSPRKPSRKSSGALEKSPSLPDVDEKKAAESKIEYLAPKQCGDKAKNYLKEFFVGGDLDDAVLSIHELIGAGTDGSVDRGAKVIEQSVLMVMEMKSEDVAKMLTVLVRCFKENKIELASIVSGLNDPLEFLSDIAIDAPLATPNLVAIIADFVKMENGVPFNFFLSSPEWFRTDGGAASLAAKVLKTVGGEAMNSESNLSVIGELMTEADKVNFSSAQEILNSV